MHTTQNKHFSHLKWLTDHHDKCYHDNVKMTLDDEDTTNVCALTDLPDEVLVRILSNVNRTDLTTKVALVNKRFQRLAKDPTLWTSLTLDDIDGKGGPQLDTSDAVLVIRRCILLDHLILAQRTDAVDLTLAASENCPRLRHLELRYCTTDADEVLRALQESPNLRMLNLVGTGRKNQPPPVNEALVKRALSELTHLNLFNTRLFAREALLAVASSCKHLIYLNLEEVTGVSMDNDLANSLIQGLKESMRGLFLDGEGLDDNSFVNLGQCRKLEALGTRPSLISVSSTLCLGVIFADEMSSQGLASISTLPNLNWLKIKRGKRLTDEDFVKAFSWEFAFPFNLLLILFSGKAKFPACTLWICQNALLLATKAWPRQRPPPQASASSTWSGVGNSAIPVCPLPSPSANIWSDWSWWAWPD